MSEAPIETTAPSTSAMDGDHVLILGASHGLGLEIAKVTFDLGAVTIKAGSTLTDGSKTAGERVRNVYFKCDLRDARSTFDFLRRLDAQSLPIDRFFWVAGILLKGDFTQQSAGDVCATIDINFRNAALVAHHVWKRMRPSKRTRSFSVIASTSGVRARNDEAIYVATKHAQVGFTRSLGLENNDPDLKVSLFLPGGMQTPFWDQRRPADYDGFLDPAKVAHKIVSSVLVQRDRYLEVEIPRGSL